MPLTILSDHEINSLLEGLTLEELEEFRHVLASALHQYSGGSDDVDGDVFQEPRGSSTVHQEAMTTTRFSSACGPDGMASKGMHMISPHGHTCWTLFL